MEKVESFQCSFCSKLYLSKSKCAECEKGCEEKQNKKALEEKTKQERDAKYKFIANNCTSIYSLSKMIEAHIKETSKGKDEWKFDTFDITSPQLVKECWDNKKELRSYVNYEATRIVGDSSISDYFERGWPTRIHGVLIFGIETGSGGGGGGKYSGQLKVNLKHFKHIYNDALKYINLCKQREDFNYKVSEANQRQRMWLNNNSIKDSVVISINDKAKYITKVLTNLNEKIQERNRELLNTEECIEYTAMPVIDYDQKELDELKKKFR